MKILSIKLRNINSLKGDWEVDFTQAPLKDAGLFAIVGPTGSGKSTLLDCITLALFNKVPRLEKISKDMITMRVMVLPIQAIQALLKLQEMTHMQNQLHS
jgi:DNA repair exonuclease SbcCD ATPase subunit